MTPRPILINGKGGSRIAAPSPLETSMRSLLYRLWLPLMALLVLSAAAPFLRAQAEQSDKKQDSTVHTPKPNIVPLNIVVPIGPTAFKADGKWHLVYELHLTNLGKWDCLLT